MSQVLRVLCVVLSLALIASSADAKPPMVKQIPLTAADLANHLGITWMSFEMTFDDPPESVSFTIEVYKEGKRIHEGESMLSDHVEKVKNHKCTVMYSSAKDKDQLQFTIVTASGIMHDVIDNPFSSPGIITRRSARPDAQGRILLAAMLPKQKDGPRNVADLTIEKATVALVIQVRQKATAK